MKDQYWLLKTEQPNFRKTLKKIGVTKNELEKWNFFGPNEEVFVFKIFNKIKEKYEFSVSHFDDNVHGIEFMGNLVK